MFIGTPYAKHTRRLRRDVVLVQPLLGRVGLRQVPFAAAPRQVIQLRHGPKEQPPVRRAAAL